MFPWIFISFRIDLTRETRQQMWDLSNQMPVFGFFFSPSCASCQHLSDIWISLSNAYANDPAILLVFCNCVSEEDICQSVTHIAFYPTFFVIFRGQAVQIRIERSLEAFREKIEDLKGFDPDLPCQRFFHQIDSFPVFGISFPDDDPSACSKLIELQRRVPTARRRLLLGKARKSAIVTIVVSEHLFSEQEVRNDLNFIESFIRDYLHVSLGNWSLQESKQIVHRRFGFLVYSRDSQIEQAQHFALLQSENFCFGLMALNEFQPKFPGIRLMESETPAIAVLNRDHTKFRLIRCVIFDDTVQQLFANMAHELVDPEMIHEYRVPELRRRYFLCFGVGICFWIIFCSKKCPRRLQFRRGCNCGRFDRCNDEEDRVPLRSGFRHPESV
jgi:hypothetical protein